MTGLAKHYHHGWGSRVSLTIRHLVGLSPLHSNRRFMPPGKIVPMLPHPRDIIYQSSTETNIMVKYVAIVVRYNISFYLMILELTVWPDIIVVNSMCTTGCIIQTLYISGNSKPQVVLSFLSVLPSGWSHSMNFNTQDHVFFQPISKTHSLTSMSGRK